MARLLTIEDNAAIRRLIVLTLDGYEVAEASDGEEGLRAAAARAPDLILLDLGLPGIPGDDVLRELKRDPSTHDIPVIVVSAWAEETEHMVRALGAADFIRKPFDLADLQARVAAALAGRRI